MAVESYYFTHDYNSRNDRKIVALRMKEGMAGVGLYWCIVEMLYEEGGYLLLSECERIAFEFRVKEATLRRIVTNFELFRNDGTKFWSESALERLKKRNTKSDKARESALERWNKRNQNANASPSDGQGIAIKERKGEEKKEKGKETGGVSLFPLVEVEKFPFADFWKLYDKPAGKKPSEKKWGKISVGDREKIMKHLVKYVAATPDRQYRKDPMTYLNNQAWEDEIILTTNGKTGLTATEKFAGTIAHNADGADYSKPI